MILTGIGIIGSQCQAPLTPVVQCFTTNGTWSCCTGAVCVQVVAIGAGGNGGNGGNGTGTNNTASGGGGGGGGGGVSICTLTSGFGTSQSIVVGSTDSCFGTLVSATKGATGQDGFTAAGGAASVSGGAGGAGNCLNGGAGGGFSYNPFSVTAQNGNSRSGGGAGRGYYVRFGSCTFSGISTGGAGSTICGFTLGAGGDATSTTGCAGINYGGGGAGGSVPGNSGGHGGSGIIQVTQYFS